MTQNMNRNWSARLGCLALCVAACGVDQLDDDGGGGGGIPTEVQERFTTNCALSGCHSPGATAPDLSAGGSAAILTSPASNGMPLVELYNVPNSYLALKILNDPNIGAIVGQPMPPPTGAPPDKLEDMSVIVGWIAGVPFPVGDPMVADDTGVGMTSMPPPDDGGSTDDGVPVDDDEDDEEDDEDSGEPEDDTGMGGGTDTGEPVEVAYADVQAIWDARCAVVGCHGAGSTAPILDAASAPASIIEVASEIDPDGRNFIEPNSLEESYLWQKLAGEPMVDFVMARMPLGGMLDEAQLATIQAWIEAGAPPP